MGTDGELARARCLNFIFPNQRSLPSRPQRPRQNGEPTSTRLCGILELQRCRDDHRFSISLDFNDQPARSKTGKKPAPAPLSKGQTKVVKNPLFESTPKNFGIGGYLPFREFFRCLIPYGFSGQDVRPTTDLTRFVKWPEYVRLQRQKVILQRRLKVSPAIAQFSHTLDKTTATQLFKSAFPPRPCVTCTSSYSLLDTDPRPSKRRKLVSLLPPKKLLTAKQKYAS